MLQHYVLNVGLQWFLFLIIPIFIYLIFFRKKQNLFAFFGLKKRIKVENSLLIITTILIVVYLLFNVYIMKNFDIGTNDIRAISFQQTGLSIETILILLINSIVQTSLLEEILFRGFLLNALSPNLGFKISNHVQSFLFTGIHFIGTIQMGLSVPTIVVANLGVYLLSTYFGKLTKESGYSVYYSAIFHGTVNILAGLFLFLPI